MNFDAQTLYFGMLTFVLVLLVLNAWAEHQEAKRAHARRNAMLHIDPAKTAGGQAGKYQDHYTHIGFNDLYAADRELEVPPDAVSEIR